VVILQNGSTISRTNTSTKTRRLYKSIPPRGTNGSLTQQIAKELSLPSFYGDRREQEKQLWHKYSTGKNAHILSAINSGVKDIREVIEKKQSGGLFTTKNPILFIDEIHRFSKSQQDIASSC
jgi:putative ATPase